MAEFDFEKEFLDNSIVENTEVTTGGRHFKKYLYYQLKSCMQKAESIDIIVSFLMETGVKLILKDLKSAINRGVKIRILTGNYMGITQPSALFLIKNELKDNVDLRFYNESNRSFHPKAYIFHYTNNSELFIGSSNLSKSALTDGIEWNYKLSESKDKKNYDEFFETFSDLFNNHSIIIDDDELYKYSKNWHKPHVYKDLEKYDEEVEIESRLIDLFQPRGAQIEALYSLTQFREQGAKKALVQAATGIGKTYLAAFDSKRYDKILFVAHRTEILKQAEQSFRNVRSGEDFGFFDAQNKTVDKSVIFASVATLGREEYLTEKYFKNDYFEYIIIDEFHHSVGEQYQRILDYFKPKFMLGLTATPERMDGKDIYKLCDYNVAYEISLKESINKGFLVPFHYYGIYDETDYSGVKQIKGHYDENDLNEIYIGNYKRYEMIYKYYKKYKSSQALAFCCSKKHALDMAREFSKRGIPSVAVYSGAEGEFTKNREEAIKMLVKEEVKIIFSVDMFNEGVDIKTIDMVLFLRPTESPVVFLQQLGRGLRLSKGKKYLNVLDFIGNYERAGKTPSFLNGKSGNTDIIVKQDDYPDDCIVDYDMKLIDLFEELNKKKISFIEKLNKEYFRIKENQNGVVPTRMDLFTYMDDEIYQYCITNSKYNPFRDYLDFLYKMGELEELELDLYNSLGKEFLNHIEKTNMQKVYKMPVLYSFYDNGKILSEIDDKRVLKKWKEFFSTDTNWKDLNLDISYEDYKNISDKEHLKKIKNMPIRFLIESGNGFFEEKDGCVLAINEKLNDVLNNPFMSKHIKDILDYRTVEYYRRRYKDKINAITKEK